RGVGREVDAGAAARGEAGAAAGARLAGFARRACVQARTAARRVGRQVDAAAAAGGAAGGAHAGGGDARRAGGAGDAAPAAARVGGERRAAAGAQGLAGRADARATGARAVGAAVTIACPAVPRVAVEVDDRAAAGVEAVVGDGERAGQREPGAGGRGDGHVVA